MKKLVITYYKGLSMIRQMPENYLVANTNNGRWVCEPDLGADKELCTMVFQALLEYDNKYTSDALRILQYIADRNFSDHVSLSDQNELIKHK